VDVEAGNSAAREHYMKDMKAVKLMKKNVVDFGNDLKVFFMVFTPSRPS
jgi:hypothetical protein